MEKQTKSAFTIYRIAFIAVMAAVVCVVTFFRFPLLSSKVHFANAMCLLSGLLLGPVGGGLAAGLGSALYDALFGGYEIVEVAITFVSKFAMAWVCAVIVRSAGEKRLRVIVGCVAGALSYVALYMLKTFVFQRFVYAFPYETVWATMLAKLPASLINAAFAIVVTPVIYEGLRAALGRTGFLEKLR